MRPLLLLAVLLGACADAPDEPAPPAPDEPTTLAPPEADRPEDGTDSPAPAPLGLEDLAGDWVFCSGDGALDEAATFEGAEMRTYLHDRPALATSVEVDGGAVVFDGRTYQAARDGEVLTLDDDLGRSVYARSVEACP